MTAAEFLSRHPEFKTASDSLIDIKLADATARIHQPTFGTSYSQALAYLTAHLLVSSPWGRSLRAELNGEPDEYIKEYDLICSEKIPRMFVV